LNQWPESSAAARASTCADRTTTRAGAPRYVSAASGQYVGIEVDTEALHGILEGSTGQAEVIRELRTRIAETIDGEQFANLIKVHLASFSPVPEGVHPLDERFRGEGFNEIIGRVDKASAVEPIHLLLQSVREGQRV